MTFLRGIVWFVCVLGGGLAPTWAEVPKQISLTSPYLVTRWTTENGLPQNSVTALAQTPDGYLWLGTFGGLARFDGVKFTTFNSANTPALPNNRITTLHLGRYGTLWVGAENGEITQYRDGKFTFFARLPLAAVSPETTPSRDSGASLPSRFIGALYEDRVGTLWVGMANDGVHCYVAGDAARLEHYGQRHGLTIHGVQGIAEDREGRLWFCARDGLAVLQEPPAAGVTAKKFQLQMGQSDEDEMLRIRPHPDGGLWLLTRRRLLRWHEGRLTRYLEIPYYESKAGAMSETAKGELLFSDVPQRLFKIPPGPPAVLTPLPLEARVPGLTMCLLEDREGNRWLGTNGNGLLRVRQQHVTMLDLARGQHFESGTPLLQDDRGDFWLGSLTGLFRHTAQGQVQHYAWGVKRAPGDWRVTGLYQDRVGAVWIGRNHGLTRYHDGQFTLYPLSEVGQIAALTEDREGQLWLGARKGLLHFHDGQARLYTTREGLVDDDVKFLFGDRHGAVWAGTPGGLSRFANGVFTNFTTREGLSNDYVREVLEDRDGALWIGTYGGGLNRMKDGRIAHITTKQGLHDDFISRILVDEEDRFWLLSNHGVFRVSRQALNEVAEGRQPKVRCVVYDAADGMNPSEGQGGQQPSGWRARDGRLWFATIKGIAIVDPGLENLLPPPVHIERVLLDDVERDAYQPLVVQPGQGNLEIQYTGLSLGKAEQVQFRYQLSGQQETWEDVGTRRTAYFSQLPPGTYRFNVQALSPDGVWSVQPASLNIVVKPRLWQTWWFRGLSVLLVAGLLVLGYRQRVKFYQRRSAQQEAFARQLLASQEHERERIAAELHDSLSQSLTIIKNRALAALKVPDDHKRSQEQLQEIAEASSQTIDEVKEIIYDLHPIHLSRLGLTDSLNELLRDLRETHELTITSELDRLDDKLSADLATGIYRIAQESLTNVIKHAAARIVIVRLQQQAGHVLLLVQDDGRGFTPAALPVTPPKAGMGIINITERARLLGGEASIESTPGAGTTVRVSLPLRKI